MSLAAIPCGPWDPWALRVRVAFLALLAILNSVPVHGHNKFDEKVLHIDGDIKLGALFPIHKRGNDRDFPCGEIQKEDGIQPLEALLFTLDKINNDPMLLPHIKLGVKAVDSCDDPIYAAEKALSLLDGFVSRTANLSCGQTSSSLSSSSWPCDDNIVGLVGPQTSPVSVQVANLGRLFRVPQVSYLATSNALCATYQFPYFFRTVPSDKHQADAIVKLLITFNWNYASIVHSDSDYGETGYEALTKTISEMKLKSICLADPITIYNDHFGPTDYEKIIRQLLKNAKSRVVIVFADRVPAGKLLEAALKLNVKDKFVWVGSDAWASRESVVENKEEVIEGAIAVQPLRRELPGYNRYFTSLINKENRRNPWFEEYLQRYHNCSDDIHCSNSRHENFRYSQQQYIHFIRDAVYAFAHALHAMHVDECGGFARRLCPAFRRRVFFDLHLYLRNVSFPDVTNKSFSFYGDDEHDKHDGPPRYSVINFQRTSDGNYDWKSVGTFHNGNFSDWDRDFRRKLLEARNVTQCQRQTCSVSQIMVQNTNDLCCWHCRECGDFEFKQSKFVCAACPDGEQSASKNRTGCEQIPETYLHFEHSYAITAMCIAAAGIALTVITAVVFWKYWDTPVVKACGRELSLMLLLGTLFSFATTFAIVAKPTVVICSISRYCVGLCYTICYAAVVTKTNRVSRIFNANQQNTRLTSPLSTLSIASLLVAIEMAINVAWFLFDPPSTDHITDKPKKRRILVCTGLDSSFIVGLFYPFILILCATWYAFDTRKCPDGYNETRYIFFANIFTCIHWVVYVPLFLASTDREVRAVILAISLSVSGIVQLSCLLMPKLYTVVFKPEKNTKEVVMTLRKNRSYGGVPGDTPPHSGSAKGVVIGVTAPPSPLPGQLISNKLTESHSAAGILSQQSSQDDPELASVRSRQLTWSCNSREAQALMMSVGPRARSSSVCKGTQTLAAESKAGSGAKKDANHEQCAVTQNSDDEEEVHCSVIEVNVNMNVEAFDKRRRNDSRGPVASQSELSNWSSKSNGIAEEEEKSPKSDALHPLC